MINKEQQFNEYLNNFKKLDTDQKRKIVYEEIKKLIMFIDVAKEDLNINDSLLSNKELLDLNYNDVSYDEFINKVFSCVYIIQESLGKYFNEVSKILYR